MSISRNTYIFALFCLYATQVLAEIHLPKQSEDPIANYAWDENEN